VEKSTKKALDLVILAKIKSTSSVTKCRSSVTNMPCHALGELMTTSMSIIKKENFDIDSATPYVIKMTYVTKMTFVLSFVPLLGTYIIWSQEYKLKKWAYPPVICFNFCGLCEIKFNDNQYVHNKKWNFLHWLHAGQEL
jgi:hypothetical protein